MRPGASRTGRQARSNEWPRLTGRFDAGPSVSRRGGQIDHAQARAGGSIAARQCSKLPPSVDQRAPCFQQKLGTDPEHQDPARLDAYLAEHGVALQDVITRPSHCGTGPGYSNKTIALGWGPPSKFLGSSDWPALVTARSA